MAQSIPLPNDKMPDGALVIASVVVNDDDPAYISALLLLLHPAPVAPEWIPKGYEVREVSQAGRPGMRGPWVTDATHGRFANIVPAVECYADNGGDY